MGITSSLFFSSNDIEKQTLHRRITPSREQFEDQQNRWNDLAEYLIADLRDRSQLTIRTWLQGSYKFGTQIRGVRKGEEFDVDLGVYFEWDGSAYDGPYDPLDIRKTVQESLEGYSDDSVISVLSPPKMRCSRIRFEGDFHIDVPTYHLDSNRDKRMLATLENGWEDSDPKALYVWFVESFDEQLRAKARRQIRYLKTWSALNCKDEQDRPSSTLLTVLVAEAICTLSDDDVSSDDDALARVVERIIERLENSSEVGNPAAAQYENLAQRLNDEAFSDFLNGLSELHDTANSALASDDIVSAADTWSHSFAHFFPMPDETELEKAAKRTSHLPVRAIFPEIHVRAVPQKNRNKEWQDVNTIGPIPKGCDIYFSINNPDEFPENVEFNWMVRNEGNEAENTNDLGHRAGQGLIAEEKSAYSGTHYMDCIVRQHGQIIGMRRVPVIIAGIEMPHRNPDKRPSWVKLRGRR